MSKLTISTSYSSGSLVVTGAGKPQTIQLTTPGKPSVVQLGTLSAAANQQITQAVASAAASASTATSEAGVATAAAGTATSEALAAAESAAASANAYSAIANGTAFDAGMPSSFTGNEVTSLSRGIGLLQTTFTKLMTWGIQFFKGFIQNGTGAVARTVQSKLAENVTVLDTGTLTSGTADQSAAINAAIALLPRYPLASPGGVIRLPPGSYALSAPIIVPFGFSLEGSGSDIYTSKLSLNSNFSGAGAVVVQDSNASYLNAHVRNLGIDCGNLSGVAGVLFYGAYRNSSVENVVVQNVAGNAHGIQVAPQVGGTSRPVCESFTLRNVYVIKAAGVTSTQSGILLDTVQESTLINVKSFHGTNPGASGGWSCIHLRDCRGITMINGGVVAGDNGILVEALNRSVVGITIINPTFENLGASNLKIRGTGSNTVSGVKMLTAREESPKAPVFLDADNIAFMDVDIADGSALLGAGVNNSVIRGSGAGTITPTTGAQYTTLFYGNQTRQTYQVSPALEIYATTGPVLQWSNVGFTGNYKLYWSASATQDFGWRATDRFGSLIFNHTTTNSLFTWSQANAFVRPTQLGPFTVANLPATFPTTGNWLAFATNGRKVGEGAGSGTGVPVYYSNGAWRVFSTDAAVQA